MYIGLSVKWDFSKTQVVPQSSYKNSDHIFAVKFNLMPSLLFELHTQPILHEGTDDMFFIYSFFNIILFYFIFVKKYGILPFLTMLPCHELSYLFTLPVLADDQFPTTGHSDGKANFVTFFLLSANVYSKVQLRH